MSTLRWYNFTSFHSHVFIHKTLLSLFLLFSLSSHEPFYYPLLPLAAYFFLFISYSIFLVLFYISLASLLPCLLSLSQMLFFLCRLPASCQQSQFRTKIVSLLQLYYIHFFSNYQLLLNFIIFTLYKRTLKPTQISLVIKFKPSALTYSQHKSALFKLLFSLLFLPQIFSFIALCSYFITSKLVIHFFITHNKLTTSPLLVIYMHTQMCKANTEKAKKAQSSISAIF